MKVKYASPRLVGFSDYDLTKGAPCVGSGSSADGDCNSSGSSPTMHCITNGSGVTYVCASGTGGV